MLCVPELEQTDVTRVPGDSDLPFAGPSFGSGTTLGMGAAVQDAARRVVAQLAGWRAGRPRTPSLRKANCIVAAIPGRSASSMRLAWIRELAGAVHSPCQATRNSCVL